MATEMQEYDLGLQTHGQMLVELADMMHECGGEPFCIDDALLASWNERLFGSSKGAGDALGRLQRMKLVAHDGTTAGGMPLYVVTPTGRDCAEAARHELATLRMDRAMVGAFEACDAAAEQDAQVRRTTDATRARMQSPARGTSRPSGPVTGPLKAVSEIRGLMIARREGEAIVVGDGERAVYVKLARVQGEQARIIIDAPDDVPVDRYEIRQQQIAAGGRAASSSTYEPTQTADEAFARIMQARLGSLAGTPSPKYLKALREQLYKWLHQIEDVIADQDRDVD